ncbi:uncharacterized protein LOC119746471 isoform X3 [Patiria miniata]|uniref:Uncharacterized protein n=1 Tax=Patiria miniata TaxID=46514 RepID=A0A914BSU5_PATMI|nr:uncharacterized protein LOC119746471 isoform X3 [Patiria miniata]
MADPLFPAKRSIFVKTYSKIRPLQTFDPDPLKSFKNTCGATPILRTGKPFPFIQPANSIAPTLAPANSPSSDTSSSETPDVEMISNEVEKKLDTEEEDEKSFITLTPTSKKTSKKQSKKKSYSPLKNISNVIKVMHPRKTAPKRVVSPFMWTSTKLRPQGQLASIQESDQESVSSDDQECTNDAKDESKGTASNRKPDRISNLPKGPHHTKKLVSQDIQTGAQGIPLHSQKRSKDSPMMVEGRGVFTSSYSSTMTDQRSTQMYGSQTDDEDDMSTVTYTRQSGETSDESTMVISDVATDDNDSMTTATVKEEEFSDIEIPRDFPGTTRVMQQLTPTVANLVLPEASERKTLRKTTVSTAKAMPKKRSSVWSNRKPTVKTKNSTLVDGLTALNIQQYEPIEEISDIKEDNSRGDLDPNKKTSTPSSKGRNTMLHQRFIPDVSSIEGDACAMPTIDVMQSLTSTTLADKMKSSSTQKLAELRPVTAPSETKGPAPRSVYSISASSDDDLPTPLGIRGRKAFTIERASPRMSPRLSFGQYPKAATKMISNSQKKTSVVSAGNLSRNDSSSNKHVKFLLSNKAHEVLPEPDPSRSLSIVNLPELPLSSSILKKRETMTGERRTSFASKIEEHTKQSSKQEKQQTGRTRMTSTPQKHSRRSKGAHMLALSFDVSSVDLPSCSDDDVITQPSNHQTESKTTAVVTDREAEEEETITAAGQSTQELMDFEPIPMQASTSINSQPLHLSQVIQEDTRPANLESQLSDNATKHLALATQRATSNPEAIQHPAPATQRYRQAQHPSIATPQQNACQRAEHPVRATDDQRCHRLQEAKKSLRFIQATPSMRASHQEAQNLVQGTQHPLQGTHDEFNPQGDFHPVSGTDDLCSPNGPDIESQQETEYPAPDKDDMCVPQGAENPVYGTHDQLSPRNTQYPDDSTLGTKEAEHPIHATPKSQLKRSSPNGDLPGRPNKKKFLKKDASDEIMVTTPQTCDRATQKDFPRQQKRLDYVDKAVGLPECIFSQLGPTPYRPAKFRQYIDTVNVMDYDKIKNLPQDIFETIPDAVFS